MPLATKAMPDAVSTHTEVDEDSVRGMDAHAMDVVTMILEPARQADPWVLWVTTDTRLPEMVNEVPDLCL